MNNTSLFVIVLLTCALIICSFSADAQVSRWYIGGDGVMRSNICRTEYGYWFVFDHAFYPVGARCSFVVWNGPRQVYHEGIITQY